MANIQSQIKRNRQNLVRHERNKAVRSEIKTYMRKFNAAVQEGDRDAAETWLRTASRKLDKAVSKGVVKRNNAANKKSRMAARLNAL